MVREALKSLNQLAVRMYVNMGRADRQEGFCKWISQKTEDVRCLSLSLFLSLFVLLIFMDIQWKRRANQSLFEGCAFFCRLSYSLM